MICLDTTFLIDLWRSWGKESAAAKFLKENSAEKIIVPVTAAGEFLEGSVSMDATHWQESLRLLHIFELADLTETTAVQYAKIAADLRLRKMLGGTSKADIWNAACAMEHGAALVTRNARDFNKIKNLMVMTY